MHTAQTRNSTATSVVKQAVLNKVAVGERVPCYDMSLQCTVACSAAACAGHCCSILACLSVKPKHSCLQVLDIQVDVYQYLGAGPAAFLYDQIANEQEATLEERAQYRLLQIYAQSRPYCADVGDLDPARPRVSPAHLLAVPYNADADEVRPLRTPSSRLHALPITT